MIHTDDNIDIDDGIIRVVNQINRFYLVPIDDTRSLSGMGSFRENTPAPTDQRLKVFCFSFFFFFYSYLPSPKTPVTQYRRVCRRYVPRVHDLVYFECQNTYARQNTYPKFYGPFGERVSRRPRVVNEGRTMDHRRERGERVVYWTSVGGE